MFFYKNESKIKKQSGFTLIELIVSIFIIATLTGIFLVNYHSTNKRQELIMAAQQMASDIRLAQSYALGLKEEDGSVPEGGWGVHFSMFSPDEYLIFADIDNGSGLYFYSTITPADPYTIISLPNGISIVTLSTTGMEADIVFDPPDPIIYINADTAITSVQITLGDGETTKTIEVNFLGLIDIID